MVLLSVTLIASLAAISFFYKADSALGRLLIWKVALRNFPEYAVNGVGAHKFGAVYNSWQSDYFSLSPRPEGKEIYLADNTFYAFNEYIQLAVEVGAIPFFFFLSWIIYRILRDRNNVKDQYNLFLLAIGTSALTFYTLDTTCIQIIVVLVLGFISNANDKAAYGYSRPMLKYLLLIPCCLLIKALIVSGLMLKGIPHWKNGRAEIEFNEQGAFREYDKASAYLSGEGQFMIEFAYFLSRIKKYSESIITSKISQEHRVYQSTYLNLGHCYESLGNYVLAEYNYKKAIYCIPSRLGPRYKLILLYSRLRMNNKLKLASQEALALALKNPNDELSIELMQAIREIYESHKD